MTCRESLTFLHGHFMQITMCILTTNPHIHICLQKAVSRYYETFLFLAIQIPLGYTFQHYAISLWHLLCTIYSIKVPYNNNITREKVLKFMDLHQDQEKVSFVVTVKELKNRKQLFLNALCVYIAISVFKSCCSYK